jgi:hypothetical protein
MENTIMAFLTRLEFRQDQPLCQISMKLELVERYRLVYSEKTYFLSEFYRFVLEKWMF